MTFFKFILLCLLTHYNTRDCAWGGAGGAKPPHFFGGSNSDFFSFTFKLLLKIIQDKSKIMLHDELKTSFSFHRELFWKIKVHGC